MRDKTKIVYIDMDCTLCDFRVAYDAAKRDYPDIEFPQSTPGFFEGLEPLKGAVEAFKWLSSRDDLDVYILTAPSVKNPLCYTEKRLWVEKWLGMLAAYKLIISPNKGLLKGDYLIDDNARGKGQEYFEGELLLFSIENGANWDFMVKKFL